jgi:transcriptional regulator with XRE-family HTH domain
MPDGLDLLGDPIGEPKDPRGRDAHTATDKKRSYVLACVAANWTQEQIAAAIGVTGKTLRKYYSRELAGGKAMLRAKLFVKLQEQVDAGNVSAMRLAHQLFEKADLTPERPVRPKREPKLGKKEQAALDAERPDPSSSMGELIARRMSDSVH